MTSGKFYWFCTPEDIKEPIDYVFNKYCVKSNTDSKRSLFGVGVSLGGCILSLYMSKEGKNCPLKAAVMYDMIYDLKTNLHFFKKNFFGVYDYGLGYCFYLLQK